MAAMISYIDSAPKMAFYASNPEPPEMVLAAPYLTNLNHGQKLYMPPSMDDDGLSCTSTEDLILQDFTGPPIMQATFSTNESQTTLASIDENSHVLKLQEQVRELKRLLEREKYQNALLQNKYRCLTKDKSDVDKKQEQLMQIRSGLEQQKLEMDAKIRSIEYKLNEETEKRRSAEMLLQKTKEQLDRKENQYTMEIEDKQKAELTLRNNTMELRASTITIKQLTDQKAELERMIEHERNARTIQDEISHEQQITQLKLQETTRNLDTEKSDMLQKLEYTEENRRHIEGSLERYKAELYSLKLEIERIQARRSDEQAMAIAEADALQAKIEDLKDEVKLNEEALSQATIQYNVQLSQLKTELAMVHSSADRDRAAKEKLESQIDSFKHRLNGTSQQLEKSQMTRTELERSIQKEKEEWSRYSDRKEQDIKSLQDNNQSLQQRVTSAESRQMSLDMELKTSNANLIRSTDQLNQLQREYDYKKSEFDNYHSIQAQEREKCTKLSIQVETAHERCNALMHENTSIKQCLEAAQRALEDRGGAQIQQKLNDVLDGIKAFSDKNKSNIEENNKTLTDNITRLKEELRNSENRRMTMEIDIKRIQEEKNDFKKHLSQTECSLKVAEEVKEKLEKEKARLLGDLDKMREKYHVANEKTIELGARVTGMADVVGQTQSNTQTQLSDRSDHIHKLEVENARLDSDLRYARQQLNGLSKDLEDSHKVRNSLEALCANLKTANQHLTGKLGDEVLTKTHLFKEAEASKGLWEAEVVTKNKLGQQVTKCQRKQQETQSLLDEEGYKLKRAIDAKTEAESKLKEAESKLQIEVDKNMKLQSEVAQLRTYLKLAMFRLNVCNKIIAAHSS